MKKTFEEPTVECFHLTTEVIADNGIPVPSEGYVSFDPFLAPDEPSEPNGPYIA